MQSLRDYPFAVRPLIIAHRGDTSLGATENSIEAAVAGAASGADMIEVDVQWTADEEFVCWHDQGHPQLDVPVHRAMFKECQEAGIASLVEIAETVKGKVYLNIEIKEYSDRSPRRFMQRLVELIIELGLRDHVLLSSFRIDFLQEAGWELPTFVIHPDEEMKMLMTLRAHDEPIKFEKPLPTYLPSELMKIAKATGYGCQLSDLTPDGLVDIRMHNILLGVYTITTEEEFEQAIARGARALVCERPHEFAALRNKRFPSL
jgi:glycerophosphoryl diester phosphodiesterase